MHLRWHGAHQHSSSSSSRVRLAATKLLLLLLLRVCHALLPTVAAWVLWQ
jgi:hypothetical protein